METKEFKDQLTIISDDLNHGHLSVDESLVKLKVFLEPLFTTPPHSDIDAKESAEEIAEDYTKDLYPDELRQRAKKNLTESIESYAQSFSPTNRASEEGKVERILKDEERSLLYEIRNYFGEHDKTGFEHRAYAFLDGYLSQLDSYKPEEGERDYEDKLKKSHQEIEDLMVKMKEFREEWISVEDRLPTKKDGDKHGRVWVYEPVLRDMKAVTYLSVNVKIGDKWQYPKWKPLPDPPLMYNN